MADAKNVWSWRKIVESSARFDVDSGACVLERMDASECFRLMVD